MNSDDLEILKTVVELTFPLISFHFCCVFCLSTLYYFDENTVNVFNW